MDLGCFLKAAWIQEDLLTCYYFGTNWWSIWKEQSWCFSFGLETYHKVHIPSLLFYCFSNRNTYTYTHHYSGCEQRCMLLALWMCGNGKRPHTIRQLLDKSAYDDLSGFTWGNSGSTAHISVCFTLQRTGNNLQSVYACVAISEAKRPAQSSAQSTGVPTSMVWGLAVVSRLSEPCCVPCLHWAMPGEQQSCAGTRSAT